MAMNPPANDLSATFESGIRKLPEKPAASTTDWGKAPPVPAITRFLRGPQRRRFELGRAAGIFFEIVRGFRRLHFVGPCVTVFGSARFTPEHPYYHLAHDIGGRLGWAGPASP